jgi:hypothetical protein
MSEIENQPEMSGDPLVEDLQNEVQSLRTLLSVSLIVLLVFAICMNFFLGIQISQINKARDQAQQSALAISEQAKDMWHKLNDFSRSNADFAPTLEKYRQIFTNQPAAAAPAPASTTRPVAPAAPKK